MVPPFIPRRRTVRSVPQEPRSAHASENLGGLVRHRRTRDGLKINSGTGPTHHWLRRTLSRVKGN